MEIKFSVAKMPFDYKMDYPNIPHVISVGMYSYSGNELIHFGGGMGQRPFCNILIGRFCSLAEPITFIIGLNHAHKNVITTYPFDDRWVSIEFLNLGKGYQQNLIPNLRETRNNRYQIIIGNDVWIGMGSTIIGGVKIGSGAIIGTNAMVTKDVPPYAIAVGNPARVVKYRFDAETIRKLMALKWWNWDISKVLENVNVMYEPEKFLAEHYSPGMELALYAKIGGGRNWNVTSQKAETFTHSWQIFAHLSRSGNASSAAFSNRRKETPCCYSGWATARRRLILRTLKLSSTLSV